MNFRVLHEAYSEAITAAIWYDDRQPGLGDDFLSVLRLTYDSIRTNPAGFPLVEYGKESDQFRRCRMKRFPYVAVFLCRPDEIVIVAVAHTRRRPLYWLSRLE